MAGAIPNGMLCYTGLTPGSTATYSCDKGYELSGSSVLECQANGVWNEIGSICLALESGLSRSLFLYQYFRVITYSYSTKCRWTLRNNCCVSHFYSMSWIMSNCILLSNPESQAQTRGCGQPR